MNKIRMALLNAEWAMCMHSDLVPEYDQGDSYWYAEAKRLGCALVDVEGKSPVEDEIWLIPQEWLDE